MEVSVSMSGLRSVVGEVESPLCHDMTWHGMAFELTKT